MKTFDERKQSVEQYIAKIHKKRRKAAIAATSVVLVVSILALVLFLPYNTTPPSVRQYAGSEYYGLIKQLNTLIYEPPAAKNNFEALTQLIGSGLRGMTDGQLKGDAVPRPGGIAPSFDNVVEGDISSGVHATGTNGEQYVEVTDNQVSGVTEADIFKRSDKYVYYLRGAKLSVYSIEKENSQCVGSFSVDYHEQVNEEISAVLWYPNGTQMYLSQDCRTVTVIVHGYHTDMKAFTMIVNLDVSDPANIKETNRVYFIGSYISSRVVDGDLLLIYNYGFRLADVDFDDPSTYVPQYGTPGNMTCIPGDTIICPENASNACYTVVCKLDGVSLDIQGTAAMLSYHEELYVSEDTIYATYSYSEKSQEIFDNQYRQTNMTDITGISYTGDSLEILDTIALEGIVRNQYSMDQHEGILRVVTSTTVSYFEEVSYEKYASTATSRTERNVNLYCIDLKKWKIKAEVIAFAPDGEDAQSVRFDGDHAYVCTAEVITMTDPVYFFDLSDLDNITWTDTGTIDGYSTSLIQLGDGYLMGVGYGANRDLKIEIYEERDGKVVSVSAYERDANFSTDYKSYLIDREKNLIGLAVRDDEMRYLLLQFDGYELRELAVVDFHHNAYDVKSVRAFLADGWLYILSQHTQDILAQQIW